MEDVEAPEEIKRAINRALRPYPPEKLFLHPDCGFGTFSNRPLNSSEVAFKKLQSIVTAAAEARGRF